MEMILNKKKIWVIFLFEFKMDLKQWRELEVPTVYLPRNC